MSARLRKPCEVFLSHSSRDRDFAIALKKALNRHGVKVWFSVHHIKAAKQWHNEIGQALNRCDWFAVILTPNSVKSVWVERELLFALDERRYHEHIIPLIRRTCRPEKLSWTLPAFQMIDFRAGEELAATKLLAIWNIKYDGAPFHSRRSKLKPGSGAAKSNRSRALGASGKTRKKRR